MPRCFSSLLLAKTFFLITSAFEEKSFDCAQTSSCPGIFHRISVLSKFEKILRKKRPMESLQFVFLQPTIMLKLEIPSQVFTCVFCEIFETFKTLQLFFVGRANPSQGCRPLRGVSLLLTTKTPRVFNIHLIDRGLIEA